MFQQVGFDSSGHFVPFELKGSTAEMEFPELCAQIGKDRGRRCLAIGLNMESGMLRELGVAYNEVGDSVPQIVPTCQPYNLPHLTY